MSEHAPTPPGGTHTASHFLRQIIERDLLQGRLHGRRWAGTPGDGTHHARGNPDPAKVRLRFPPEPNGYLHVGHAKSIWINFGLARDYGGVCHMRFDDTNPEKEEQEYVDAILDAVRWLGWSWDAFGTRHLYYASNYFDFMYRAAEYLIETGHAYVDEQTPEQMRANRGTLTEPGVDSPFRHRPVEESLARFREMRAGRHPDGAMVLRAKIDMASPNINLRDPAIYRIKHATHHNTGNAWCIYPMYTFAHPIEDALENITHSICTLEFEDQRPFYDWLLERIVPILRAPQFERAKQLIERLEQQGVEAGKEFALHCHNHAHKLGPNTEPERQMRALFQRWEHDRDAVLHDLPAFFALLKANAHQFTPLLAASLDAYEAEIFQLPHQYEFARLNLTYVVTSKRKLKQLVDEGIVRGWDDPRMPTIVGLRRRGYTPEAIRLFCERTGVSKANGWIDYGVLEGALRDDLEGKAARAMAVLDPIKLRLTNWAEVFGRADHREPCSAPVHPQRPELGQRRFSLGPELWIEREDFQEQPPKGYFRLFPGNKVRLKYGYVIECTGCEKDADGRVTAVLATVVPDTKSGTPGADAVKVKGTITWVGVHEAVPAEIRLYDRLFADAHPDAGGKDFKAALNPDSLHTVTGYVEPSLAGVAADERFQFERHGYFVTDRLDHTTQRPVFNRIVGLKDRWTK
ncbi:glutamine--tRNA ligase [Tepidimonas taiwanensis]|uniref:Glutamine--tRNA ligase n=1 Tax=Tepidimonas taiwanensis TaxID=307486 RepID=A0A554XBG0_9BURK|nr:glutamine--tRNA ligase [Tepidimonas taiwanensis]TSE33177.1 Glutamine--tRNA ligase [Tepidimonas taiwanensis]UBQ05924.1 glutamine--tRNA ligase [Tepidimonas taiwanensis]